MKTGKETLRDLARRVLKQHGNCTNAEAQILARGALLYTGGIK
jgi:hypothetical protein